MKAAASFAFLLAIRTGHYDMAGARDPSTLEPKILDGITVHRHTANGSALTFSSPLLRIETAPR